MKIGEAEIWLRQQLQIIYDQREAANIASMVLENITGYSRLERIAKKEELLNVHQLHHLTEFNQRLQQHEPVQYVLSEAWFFGMKLFVSNDVLIPRPETEELVQWVIEDVKKRGMPVFGKSAVEADATTQLKIMDIGTGSGCIALALKKAMPKAEVWGCDISDSALNVARRNGAALDIRVDFVGLNFLDADQCKQLPTVDIVVSNPPYIPLHQKAHVQPNVAQHEPHTALFVPDEEPLIFYKALADFGKHRLYPNGSIYCEINEEWGNAVVELFQSEGYASVVIKKDMQGKDRMVKAISYQSTDLSRQ